MRSFTLLIASLLPQYVFSQFQNSVVTVYYMQSSIIALYANINTSTPMLVSGAIFIFTGFIALLLPIEPRGRAIED